MNYYKQYRILAGRILNGGPVNKYSTGHDGCA